MVDKLDKLPRQVCTSCRGEGRGNMEVGSGWPSCPDVGRWLCYGGRGVLARPHVDVQGVKLYHSVSSVKKQRESMSPGPALGNTNSKSKTGRRASRANM